MFVDSVNPMPVVPTPTPIFNLEKMLRPLSDSGTVALVTVVVVVVVTGAVVTETVSVVAVVTAVADIDASTVADIETSAVANDASTVVCATAGMPAAVIAKADSALGKKLRKNDIVLGLIVGFMCRDTVFAVK